MTGSGVVVSQLSKCAAAAGDSHHLICAGYRDDDWSSVMAGGFEVITCAEQANASHPVSVSPEIPFPVPGMSDVMPYVSVRYRDLEPADVDRFVAAFRKRLTRAVDEFRPDMLHIHHLWALTELTASVSLPCVVTVHGTDLQQAVNARQHRPRVVDHLHRIGHFFAVSRKMAQDAEREYGLTGDRLSVVGNGFDAGIFNPHGPRLDADRKLVVCAGKMVWWKGFKYAIRASGRARTPHDLVLLGGGPEQERLHLEEEARLSGASVRFTGHVDQQDVAAWMRSAGVFLMSSIHEPFGLVLLEAMACGCRPVSAAEAGPLDLIPHHLVGDGLATLVDPLVTDDPDDEERYVDDLAAALDDQLARETSPETRAAVSATVGHRSWEATYAEVRNSYHSLL